MADWVAYADVGQSVSSINDAFSRLNLSISEYDSDDCSVPYEYTLFATDVCLNFSASGNASSVYFSCDGKGEFCCREHHTIDVSHVSCYDAIQSPPTAGTYSEYNITATSFDSDVCSATSLNATFERKKKLCDDEYPYDDDYNAAMASNSTRYSNYCLMTNRAPSSTPTADPTTIAPTISPSTISPSANPSTLAPSCAPTASPSTVPVGTDGYVYIQSYTASDCGGSKSFVSGSLANYCYNTGSSYRKYMFTKGR